MLEMTEREKFLFDLQGFLVVRDFLTDEEVKALNEAFDANVDEEAEGFYAVHADRAFFSDLCEFMCSGPVVVQVLEGDNAVNANREIMGATNPANADEGTIRKDFGESIEANSVHGSDSADNAAIEIAFFFSLTELVG